MKYPLSRDKGYFMCLLETGKVDIQYEERTLKTVELWGTVCEIPLVDDDARS